MLVIPRRVVPRLTDLRPDEVSDLFTTVQNVGRAIERAYKADALTVSLQVYNDPTMLLARDADILQDGIAAGQTVPHVHIHILPRHTSGPFSEDKDAMYPALEASEERLGQDLEEQKAERDEAVRKGMEVPKDEDRVPRTEDEMGKEAQWLAGFF